MKEYTPTEVKNLLNQGINLIDVREVKEVAEGKIPGAIHIPLGVLEFRIHELDKSKEYILICRSGGRSAQAARLLENNGYNVINMTGGMLAWEGPIE